MSDADDPGAALGALADGTRRAIVQRLAHGPATATQLAELAPTSRPATSQHLRVLRKARLIRGAKAGRFVIYEIDGAGLLALQAWLDELVERWAQAPSPRRPAEVRP